MYLKSLFTQKSKAKQAAFILGPFKKAAPSWIYLHPHFRGVFTPSTVGPPMLKLVDLGVFGTPTPQIICECPINITVLYKTVGVGHVWCCGLVE